MLLVVVCLSAAGEVFLRVWLAHRDSMLIVPDATLGWRAKRNVHFIRTKKDAAGAAHQVNFATDGQGFRLQGDPNTEKTKLFFVGDSFTHAAKISNDQTYYGVIQKRLGDRAAVFAYGALGFGTLQETMVAREHAPRIEPDWVIVQATGNDFINNSYELEINSYGSNNNKRRPYLQRDGSVVYRIPQRRLPWLYGFAFDHSRVLYYLLSRGDRLLLDPGAFTAERDIRRDSFAHPEFLRAMNLTGQMLRQLKADVAPAKVAVFIVDGDAPYAAAWAKVAEAEALPFTTAVAQAIHAAEKSGKMVRGHDRVHWNALGHRLAAEALVEKFFPEIF